LPSIDIDKCDNVQSWFAEPCRYGWACI